MITPDGNAMWGKFVYEEIVPEQKIIFINSFCDENESLLRHPLSNTWPIEVRNELTLVEQNGETQLIMSGAPIRESEEERNTFFSNVDNMLVGFDGTFNQLDDFLSTRK